MYSNLPSVTFQGSPITIFIRDKYTNSSADVGLIDVILESIIILLKDCRRKHNISYAAHIHTLKSFTHVRSKVKNNRQCKLTINCSFLENQSDILYKYIHV